MKKIFCLALVLVLTMSVAFSASAAGLGDLSNIQLPTIEMPQFGSVSDAFDAIAEFFKFEAIMVYVNDFHVYMADFYREFDTFLKSLGVVVNGILSSFFF